MDVGFKEAQAKAKADFENSCKNDGGQGGAGGSAWMGVLQSIPPGNRSVWKEALEKAPSPMLNWAIGVNNRMAPPKIDPSKVVAVAMMLMALAYWLTISRATGR